MEAREILDKVESTYRDCTVYRDSGTTTLRGDLLGTFTTEYRRDVDELCFSYKFADDAWVELKGAKGKVAHYRSEPPEFAAREEVTSETALRSIVTTLCGVTFGSAWVVPGLLLPAWIGQPFRRDCSILGRERLEGEPCKWIYLGGGLAVAVETGAWRVRRIAMFLSDVVASDGRVLRPSDPGLALSARAATLIRYEIHELS